MLKAQEQLSNVSKDLRQMEQPEKTRRSFSSKQVDDLEKQSVRLCLPIIMASEGSAPASSPAISLRKAIGVAQASKALSASEESGREERIERKPFLPLPLSRTKKDQEEKGTRIMDVRTEDEDETRTTQKRPFPLPLWKRHQEEKQGEASDDIPLAPPRKTKRTRMRRFSSTSSDY